MTASPRHTGIPLHLCGVVLPGGEKRDIYVIGGRISFDEPADAVSVLNEGFLIPGLVDVHAHLGLASPAPEDATDQERARASLRDHLAAGVLAVREPGGPNRASAGIGDGDGLPTAYTGGRFLTRPQGYFPGLAREVPEDRLPEAAEEEARASGAWAKVIGEWVGPGGRPAPTFDLETISEAVRRVHALGARIALHTMSPAGAEVAIAAGVDSLEHGLGLRDEQLQAMAAAGTAFVPTLCAMTDVVPEMQSTFIDLGFTPPAACGMVEDAAAHRDTVRRAMEAGVEMYAGTDAGMVPHGVVSTEIRYLIQAGLSGHDALAAGSWRARAFLGLPSIEPGARADLVAFRDDPREDPAQRPVLRILAGRLLDGPPR